MRHVGMAGALLAGGMIMLASRDAVGDGPPAPLPVAPAPRPVEAALPVGAVLRFGSAALRHPDQLRHLRFTADGRHLLSYGGGKLRRWDARTGTAVPDPARDISPGYGGGMLAPDLTRVIAPHLDRNPDRLSVREVDLLTGRFTPLFPIPLPDPREERIPSVWNSRFDLSPDGTLLAQGCGGSASVWDLRTRTMRFRLKLPEAVNDHFQFAPDGKHLVTGGANGLAVQFWDVTTGKEARTLRHREAGSAGALAVSADGRWAAAVENGGENARLAVWDLTTADPPRVVGTGDTFGLGALAFGPGGALYVVRPPWNKGVATTTISKWDVATGRKLAQWPGPHPGLYWPIATAVSPGGDTLAVGVSQGIIQLFDTKTGAEVARPPALTAGVIGVSYDPAAGTARAVGENGAILQWDPLTGQPRPPGKAEAAVQNDDPKEAPDPRGTVVSTDGRWLISHDFDAGRATPAELLDRATGKKTALASGVQGRVWALVPVPGGDLLVGQVETSGGYDLRVWDAATGKLMPGREGLGLRHRNRWAVAPDGGTLLVIDDERATGIDPATGRRRFTWKLADDKVLDGPPATSTTWGKVWAVALSPDGTLAAVGVHGDDRTGQGKDSLVLVEAETGRVVRRLRGTTISSRWLVFSPDGGRLAGAGGVWDVASLKETRRFAHRPELRAAAFTPDGKLVMTGYENGTVLVWPAAED